MAIVTLELNGIGFAKLASYLERHEQDIAQDVNDFGDLVGVFQSVFEAAPLAALQSPWIAWAGSSTAPYAVGVLVDIRHRDGMEYLGVPVGESQATRWRHISSTGDIVAYRLSTLELRDGV